MRAVIQRVKEASCYVEGKRIGAIKKGIVIFLGVEKEDTALEAEYLAKKIVNLRIFEDSAGKMNFSLLQIKGDVMVIPQFTLLGDCQRGLRPNFIRAASLDVARGLFEAFIKLIEREVGKVEKGKFGARMRVLVDNEGPVTLILDSEKVKNKCRK